MLCPDLTMFTANAMFLAGDFYYALKYDDSHERVITRLGFLALIYFLSSLGHSFYSIHLDLMLGGVMIVIFLVCFLLTS